MGLLQKPLALAFLIVATGAAGAHNVTASYQQEHPDLAVQSSGASSAFPNDVYPETGNRLPSVKREMLTDEGKKLFDKSNGGYGPLRIALHSETVAIHDDALNDYLRRHAGIEGKFVELAILVTAREINSEYEWTAHEPAALKAGLEPQVIDIVKYRKPVAGIAEKEAAIIQLGREAMGRHEVSSGTAARAMNLFGAEETVNIVSLMGNYFSLGMLAVTFDQHLHPNDKPLLPIP